MVMCCTLKAGALGLILIIHLSFPLIFVVCNGLFAQWNDRSAPCLVLPRLPHLSRPALSMRRCLHGLSFETQWKANKVSTGESKSGYDTARLTLLMQRDTSGMNIGKNCLRRILLLFSINNIIELESASAVAPINFWHSRHVNSLVHLSANLWTFQIALRITSYRECYWTFPVVNRSIQGLIMDVVQYFGIAQKISYLPSDDVASNVSCMKAMSLCQRLLKANTGILLLFITILI
jgi:hypothetical protein